MKSDVSVFCNLNTNSKSNEEENLLEILHFLPKSDTQVIINKGPILKEK